jgi:hypothetical protein
VRLLELEHKRAVKKIEEASKRAQHMAELKQKNDQKFMEVSPISGAFLLTN